MYRNNGYIYDLLGQSEAHLYIGTVEIEYDQMVYVGNFLNFNYGYDEQRQHGGLSFGFEFLVSFMFDRAQTTSVQPYSRSVAEGSVNFPGSESAASRGVSRDPGAQQSIPRFENAPEDVN